MVCDCISRAMRWILIAALRLPRMPGFGEGIYDERVGAGSGERLRQIPALYTRLRERIVRDHDCTMAKARVRHARLTTEHYRTVALQRTLEDPPHTLPVQLLFILGAVLALTADMVLLKEMTVMFAVTSPPLQWVVALALVLCPSVAFKLAVSSKHPPGSILRLANTRWLLGLVAVCFVSGLGWFRYQQLKLVEGARFGTRFREVLDANSVGVFLVLLLSGLALTAVTTWSLESIAHYWKASSVSRALRRQKKKLETLELTIEHAPMVLAYELKNLAACQEVTEAEYERGCAVGRLPKRKGWIAILLEGLDPRKAILTAIGFGSLSLTVGLVLSLSFGLVFGALAIPVGIVAAAALFFFTMLHALPSLKLGASASPSSARLRVQASGFIGLLVIVLAATFLSACSPGSKAAEPHGLVVRAQNLIADAADSTQRKGHHGVALVVMVDTSLSVSVSDEELWKAVMTVVSHARRCDTVTVIPVNARAGDMITKKIPCEPLPLGFDDDIQDIYFQTNLELSKKLLDWRKQSGFSDYTNTFRLANERLQGHGGGTFIVLGDLIDDQRPSVRERSPKPPLVPRLENVSFKGTQAYIGFLRSDELDSLTRADRRIFEMNWTNEITACGAASVTVRAFGLQGLEEWLDRTRGPSLPTFAAWSAEANSLTALSRGELRSVPNANTKR